MSSTERVDEAIHEWRMGWSNNDPFDEIGVLVHEVERLRGVIEDDLDREAAVIGERNDLRVRVAALEAGIRRIASDLSVAHTARVQHDTHVIESRLRALLADQEPTDG